MLYYIILQILNWKTRCNLKFYSIKKKKKKIFAIPKMMYRKQRTYFNNESSDYASITGSLLGPLLFLIYSNVLTDVIENCETYLYTDDTVLVASDTNVYNAHLNLQHDLDNITNWCKGNKLSLNIKKTKGMILGTKHKVKRAHPPCTGTIPIDYVTTYKYLGITADQSLNFNTFMNQIIKTISYKLSLLSKIKKYTTTEAAIQVYKSTFVPFFDYVDIFYNCSSSKLLNELQSLQDRGQDMF